MGDRPPHVVVTHIWVGIDSYGKQQVLAENCAEEAGLSATLSLCYCSAHMSMIDRDRTLNFDTKMRAKKKAPPESPESIHLDKPLFRKKPLSSSSGSLRHHPAIRIYIYPRSLHPLEAGPTPEPNRTQPITPSRPAPSPSAAAPAPPAAAAACGRLPSPATRARAAARYARARGRPVGRGSRRSRAPGVVVWGSCEQGVGWCDVIERVVDLASGIPRTMGTLSVAVVSPRPSKKRESTHETRSTPPGLVFNGWGLSASHLSIHHRHNISHHHTHAHRSDRAEMATRMAAPPASRSRGLLSALLPSPSSA